VMDAARLADANGAEAAAPPTGKKPARVMREPSRASGERID
jgi:hypothetical protein